MAEPGNEEVMANQDKIQQFLGCQTGDAWIGAALVNQELLLIDHAHCEKKAASTALSMMYRYVDRHELLQKMSRLAREELRHFEKVLVIMSARDIAYTHLSSSRYAQGLHQHVRSSEPDKLIDMLIVGAFIEARSYERFSCLVPHLDLELSNFYQGLLASEARHFQDYLSLAERYAHVSITNRVEQFAVIEAELISTPDPEFRFHSGLPF